MNFLQHHFKKILFLNTEMIIYCNDPNHDNFIKSEFMLTCQSHNPNHDTEITP